MAPSQRGLAGREAARLRELEIRVSRFESRGAALKAFPLRGRWHGAAVTDEVEEAVARRSRDGGIPSPARLSRLLVSRLLVSRLSSLVSSSLVSSNLVSSSLVSSNLVSSNLVSSNLDSSNLVSSNLDSSNLDSSKVRLYLTTKFRICQEEVRNNLTLFWLKCTMEKRVSRLSPYEFFDGGAPWRSPLPMTAAFLRTICGS